MAGGEHGNATICPRCGKPLVDFDAPAPAATGTTCNPINSPDCWRKTPLQRQREEFDYLYEEMTGKPFKRAST